MNHLVSLAFFLTAAALLVLVRYLTKSRDANANEYHAIDNPLFPVKLPELLHPFVLIPVFILAVGAIGFALFAPIAAIFQSHKLPALAAIFFFLLLPGIAYAYLWRFNYLTPPPKPPIPPRKRRR
jgi:NADH:ubiquinone oxidoreductase subunit 3 (subunit A)